MNRHTDRQTDRQTDRWTDRQTDANEIITFPLTRAVTKVPFVAPLITLVWISGDVSLVFKATDRSPYLYLTEVYV